MKKILFAAVVVLAFASCRKYPDFNDLSYKQIVATNHDASVNFGNYETYYMSDDVTLIGDDPLDTIADAAISTPVIQAIAKNMADRGYTRVSLPDNADLGINTAVITVTTTVVSYPPSYWWGYPGYGGCYYGYCGGYYPWYGYGYGYGYGYSYSYKTGSLMIQMADLKNVDDVNHKINIVWTNFNTGVLNDGTGGTTANVNAGVNAINQAFTQSTYLTTK